MATRKKKPTVETIEQRLRDLAYGAASDFIEEGEEKNPPARAFDIPNRGDSNTPTGGARFTLLKTFRVIAAKLSE